MPGFSSFIFAGGLESNQFLILTELLFQARFCVFVRIFKKFLQFVGSHCKYENWDV